MKSKIRFRAREIRNSIGDKAKKSQLIVSKLEDITKNYQKIGIYYPFNGEVDVLSLMQPHKEYYFPKIEGQNLEFRRFEGEFEIGEYNIAYAVGPVIDISCLDAIVIPAVAVNSKGYRLGYGKGYYDRALVSYRGLKIIPIYEQLVLEEHFEETHDLKADLVVTEKEVICLTVSC
jgi:5-formyltetrahydrofolate cyclo-ligase